MTEIRLRRAAMPGILSRRRPAGDFDLCWRAATRRRHVKFAAIVPKLRF